jgi:hypothetical protein
VIFTLFLLKFQLYDVEQTRGQNGHSGPVLDQLDDYCNKPYKVKGHDGHLGTASVNKPKPDKPKHKSLIKHRSIESFQIRLGLVWRP